MTLGVGVLLLVISVRLADSRGFVFNALPMYSTTSPATRSSRDDIVFPSDNVHLSQRAPGGSNNNKPPQFPGVKPTTADPWADLAPYTGPTADPWANMFQAQARHKSTTPSAADESIHFIDPDSLPVRRPWTGGGGVRTTRRTTRRTTPRARATTTTTPEPPPCDCPTTPEFNPVCAEVATQRVTFPNKSYLKCAEICGQERIQLLFHNSCRRIINVIRPLPVRS